MSTTGLRPCADRAELRLARRVPAPRAVSSSPCPRDDVDRELLAIADDVASLRRQGLLVVAIAIAGNAATVARLLLGVSEEDRSSFAIGWCSVVVATACALAVSRHLRRRASELAERALWLSRSARRVDRVASSDE